MIWKVLRNNIKISQLIGVFIGIMLGLTILMGALSFYIDIKPVFEDKEGFWKDEYIVISKKITLGNTFSQVLFHNDNKPLFSDSEISEIRNQDFVKDVAVFSNCSFKINAYTDEESMFTGFYTDLFFESVPDDYVDVNYDNWNWNEETEFLPVIIPKMYLNLYNFGFAQSQNLPQISESSVSAVKFNIRIRGNTKSRQFASRIVGFSERINTILVPEDFVKWGNENFGSEKNPQPGRLIVVVDDPFNSEMFEFFEERNYDVNKSEINNSKAMVFLKIIISIVFSIGMIIILLAFLLVIISIQLLLQRDNENIKKLSILGYSLSEISKPYKLLVLILLTATFICSVVLIYIFKGFYLSNFATLGYSSMSSSIINAVLFGFGLVLLIIVLLILMIKNQIKRIIY
jgi:hypothetical protein